MRQAGGVYYEGQLQYLCKHEGMEVPDFTKESCSASQESACMQVGEILAASLDQSEAARQYVTPGSMKARPSSSGEGAIGHASGVSLADHPLHGALSCDPHESQVAHTALRTHFYQSLLQASLP